MITIYNALIMFVFILGMPFIAIFVLLDILQIRERLGIKPSPRFSDQPVWIHAASIGESTIALSLAARMKQVWPEISICISIQTETGLTHLQERSGQSKVFIAPVDIFFIVNTVLHRIRPLCLLLIETEIWPNLISCAGKMGIPVGIVNGKVSGRSIGKYSRFRWLFKRVFHHIRIFCVQSAVDRERFISLGADSSRVHVLGNMKFDISKQEGGQKQIPQSKSIRLPKDRPVVVLGSVRAEEELTILEAVSIIMENKPQTLFVWVPRYAQRASVVARYLQERGITCCFRSQENPTGDCNVYLVDTMGELLDFYSFADIAFVGGSLTASGGHNPFEPASHGKPVLFGPYMEQEGYRDLIQSGGALIVGDAHELSSAAIELLDFPQKRRAMGENAKKVHRERTGVLDMTLTHLIKTGIIRR